jgi:hypothetical protein
MEDLMDRFRSISLEKARADKAVGFCETGFRIVLILLAVVGFVRGDLIEVHQGSLLYHALMTLAISFIPDFVRKNARVYITPGFRYVFLIFIFLAQFLGEIADFFNKVSWWDNMLHFVSAFAITLIGYIVAYLISDNDGTYDLISIWAVSVFAFAFSAALGAIWEIFEYLVDVTFDLNMQKSGLVDTMEDMIFCVLGSFAACLIYILDKKKTTFAFKAVDDFVNQNRRGEEPIE